MKIACSYSEIKDIQNILYTKECNIAIGDMLNDLCLIRDDDIQNIIHTNLDKYPSESKALFNSVIDIFQIDLNNKENSQIINNYLVNAFQFENIQYYEHNPYKINVKPQLFNDNKYSLKIDNYPPYTFFPMNDISVDENKNYHENTKIGIFDKPYSFLSLYKGNDLWMCITPNEMNTMKLAIQKANGNVITYGLGLGYFAYMAAIKENVNSVTIIDNDQEIIDIFLTYILPTMSCKNKIKVINSDAVNYFKNHQCEYDYTFVDLWHDADDGLPIYIKFKKYELESTTINYWIEESLVALFRRCLLTVIEEAFNNSSDSNYKKAYNNTDRIINQIYFATKNVVIRNYTDAYKLCSKANLLTLIKSL